MNHCNEIENIIDQIYFPNQILENIVHNGLMKDLSVLQDVFFSIIVVS